MSQRIRHEAGDYKTGGGGEHQGSFHVRSSGSADRPAILFLDAVADDGTITTYALWVDSTGDLRIKAANNDQKSTVVSNQDSDGTIVGTQS